MVRVVSRASARAVVQPRVAMLALALGLTSGCPGEPGEDPERKDDPPPSGTTDGGQGESTGEVYEPSEDATDQCSLAPSIGAGQHFGSLRGNVAELDGACGQGGPDAFFRLEVPRRSDVWLQGYGVGFSPRVGVLPHTCTTDWPSRTMACTQGMGTWLLDVPSGSSLVVSVGIEEDHPMLDLPPPMEGDDPLGFALDVGLRNVLSEGEPCEPPGRGRCGSGTACLIPPPPEEEPDAPPGESVCLALEGDTCGSAVPVMVEPEGISVEIDPASLQTDAHAHSCGGARTRERVLALQLPSVERVGLALRADAPGVGLALRAPGCLPADEHGCIDTGAASPPSLSVEVVGGEAFLFVELPAGVEDPSDMDMGTSGGEGTGEEAPIVVTIDVFDPLPSP